jgi:hypothetical protein
MTLGLMLILNGCFHVDSSTEMKITKVSNKDFEEIKKEIKCIANTFIRSDYDCEHEKDEFDIKDDILYCYGYYGIIHVTYKNKSVFIKYGGAHSFWIPTKEVITDEHKKIKKLFVKLAKKYHKKYPTSTIKVVFYHNDLPEDGKKLIIYNKKD